MITLIVSLILNIISFSYIINSYIKSSTPWKNASRNVPKYGERVIVCVEKYGEDKGRYACIAQWDSNKEEWKSIYYNERFSTKDYKVRYWIALPPEDKPCV